MSDVGRHLPVKTGCYDSVAIAEQCVELQDGCPANLLAGFGQLKHRLFHGFVYDYKHGSVGHRSWSGLEVLRTGGANKMGIRASLRFSIPW